MKRPRFQLKPGALLAYTMPTGGALEVSFAATRSSSGGAGNREPGGYSRALLFQLLLGSLPASSATLIVRPHIMEKAHDRGHRCVGVKDFKNCVHRHTPPFERKRRPNADTVGEGSIRHRVINVKKQSTSSKSILQEPTSEQCHRQSNF